MEIDLAEIVPATTSIGRGIALLIDSKDVIAFTPRSEKWGGGKESKRIVLNRFVLLDDLLFVGLGLWVGEGGKSKGLYFGNTSDEILLRFLNFVEEKLGFNRSNFRITLNVPSANDSAIRKWSNTLQIPAENFTAICVDPRINRDYAQLYRNSVVLIEVIKGLFTTLRSTILADEKFASAFLRGLFAAEGQVELKKSGVLFYVSFSSIDEDLIAFMKKCLELRGVRSGKYMLQARKFPIYGYRNFERFKELNIHTLHPDKREKFERGFANYKRTNVLDGDEARGLILKRLASGPKTYDDLAAALGKARTTIQAHHIPILERAGQVRRAGKRGRAWLWALAGPEAAPSQLAPEAEPAALGSPS